MRYLDQSTRDQAPHERNPFIFIGLLLASPVYVGQESGAMKKGDQRIDIVEIELDDLVELCPREQGIKRVEVEWDGR